MIKFAALLASLILLGLAVFQMALILGAPIGRFAWGGSHDILPTKLRIASAFSVFLYFVFAVIILSKAKVFMIVGNENLLNKAMWVLTFYFFVGILMNGISRSKPERLLMTPVAVTLALIFLYVTIASNR